MLAAAITAEARRVLKKTLARGEVVLITNDATAAPSLPGLHTLEPEELLPGGVTAMEPEFVASARAWAASIFAGELAGAPLHELLWTNLLRQPTLLHRIYEVTFARRALALEPSEIHLVGEAPFHAGAVGRIAAAAGRPIATGAVRARVEALAVRVAPLAAALAAPIFAAGALTRLARSVLRRRAVRPMLAPRGARPELWIFLPPAWPQPSRRLREAIAHGLQRIGRPYGLGFAVQLADDPATTEANADEGSYFDGRHDTLRPAELAQVAGAMTSTEAARTVARWLPYAVGSVARIVRHGSDMALGGQCVAAPGDAMAAVRVATAELMRTLDAAEAAERFLVEHGAPRLALLALAAPGEIKVVDHVLQRAGTTTVDFVHGYVTEGYWSTTWRTLSTVSMSWTRDQADRFAQMNTHGETSGGTVGYVVAPRTPRGSRPRVLVLSNYCEPGAPHNGRYAVRLAAALKETLDRVGNRIELRLRLHPLEDSGRYRAALGDRMPPLSRTRTLGEELAWADLVVGVPSSSYIEALLYEVPILLHRAMVIELGGLFDHVPAMRWFETPDELATQVAAFLEGKLDAGIERTLAEHCFGPTRLPGDPLASVLTLLARTGSAPYVRAVNG